MNYLVDPADITKYDCTPSELQLRILFWVCAAGKTAVTAASALSGMLTRYSTHKNRAPFKIISNNIAGFNLWRVMRDHGIGCFNAKAITFGQLASSKLNLRTCTVQDLESIQGIGPKTARCFLMHSRPDQRLAGLDTHMLKHLRSVGIDTPASTPTGRRYLELEQEVLRLADEAEMTPAEFDLSIWLQYSKRKSSL